MEMKQINCLISWDIYLVSTKVPTEFQNTYHTAKHSQLLILIQKHETGKTLDDISTNLEQILLNETESNDGEKTDSDEEHNTDYNIKKMELRSRKERRMETKVQEKQENVTEIQNKRKCASVPSTEKREKL